MGAEYAERVDSGGRLEGPLASGDWRRVGTHLESLRAAELDALRPWYRARGRQLAREVALGGAGRGGPRDGWITRVALAATLSGTPQSAAKDAGLHELTWTWLDTDDDGLLERLLLARGPAWCAEFLDAVSSLRFPGGSELALTRFARLAAAVIRRFDLPLPAGEAYARGWALLAVGRTRHDTAPKDVFDDTPHPVQTLVRLSQAEAGLAQLELLGPEPGVLAESVRRLVAQHPGVRDELLEAALATLSRGDTRNSQRAVLRILDGLDLTGEDVARRTSTLVHLVPTVHGEVTTVLVPMLLATNPPPEDLLDLGLSVLSRKEKAQKTELLRHLRQRTGDGERAVVVELLTTAAGSPDATFAARARTALDALGEGAPREAPVVVDVAWRRHPEARSAPPLERVEASRAGAATLYAETSVSGSVTGEARWLDLAVRMPPAELRAALLELPEPREGDPVAYARAREWAGGYASRAPFRRGERGWHRTSEKTASGLGTPPHEVLLERLTIETLGRLGSVSSLLSTPSRADGTVTVADLVERLRAAEDYAPIDLQLALVRLGPVAPADLEALDGAVLPPAGLPPAAQPERRGLLERLRRPRTVPPDGVDLVRQWVRAGGLPARAHAVAEGQVLASAVTLPFVLPGAEPLAHLAEEIVPAGFGSPLGWIGTASVASLFGALPWWPDTAVAIVTPGHWLWASREYRPRLTAVPGPLGPGAHHALVRELTEPAEARRLAGAAEISELAAAGRVDTALLGEASLALFARGELPLARVAAAWEHVILTGGLSSVWSAMVAVADAASRQPRLPAGLAELLRTMQPYAASAEPHVPLPPSLHALAARKGTAKAVVEARLLVAAATGGAP